MAKRGVEIDFDAAADEATAIALSNIAGAIERIQEAVQSFGPECDFTLKIKVKGKRVTLS